MDNERKKKVDRIRYSRFHLDENEESFVRTAGVRDAAELFGRLR